MPHDQSLESEQIAGLVVVELSCIEAVELAPKILPPTAAVYDRNWFYWTRGSLPSQQFVDPVTAEILVRIGDASAEFSNIGASEIETGEMLRAVARLASFCLAGRYCEGVIDGDEESLVSTLDDVADARVTERIVVWINHLRVGG